MRLRDLVDIELRADQLVVRQSDVRVAAGVWRGGQVVERSDALPDGITWSEIETKVQAESEELIAATQQAAYDARGVDVTQIDRMLALSPAERLALLDSQRNALAKFRGHEETERSPTDSPAMHRQR